MIYVAISILALVIAAIIFYLMWYKSNKALNALSMEINMESDQSAAKQIVFLPTQCQEEVDQLIHKFTCMESNFDLSELKKMIDSKSSDSGRLSSALDGLKAHVALPELQSMQELSVEAYVVEIEEVMRDYVNIIVNASQQGHDAVSKTEALLKQIDSIFSLVDGLRHIADQTGLLALNAAIEAAKTGNVGRTYSYMAKEVQRLSAQSDSFGGDIKNEMQKAKSTVEATTALVDQMVVSDLRIALETRSGIDQLIGQLQGLTVMESMGVVHNEVYGKIISEMHKIIVVVLMKIDLIQRLGLVEHKFEERLKSLNARLVSLYHSKVVKE